MEDLLTIAENLKENGNASLKANDYEKAVQFYTKAIETAKT